MRHAIKMLGLVFVLALSACGGDKRDDLGQFVGTWHATSGTLTTLCPGYTPLTTPLSGNVVVWSPGVSSDLVTTEPSTGCAIMADVTGSTASGLPGQTCTASDGEGGVSTVSFTGYTFVITPDGRTATENQSGTVTLVAGGATVVCSANATGSYQKIGN